MHLRSGHIHGTFYWHTALKPTSSVKAEICYPQKLLRHFFPALD